MKNIFYWVLLLVIWIIIWVVLNFKFWINFGFDKMLWNWVSSWFENSIKAPANMMKEAGNMKNMFWF